MIVSLHQKQSAGDFLNMILLANILLFYCLQIDLFLKNLSCLIEAFAVSSSTFFDHTTVDLCLLGDGEQRNELESICRAHDLPCINAAPWDECAYSCKPIGPRILFPGFRQIDELPRFYAHALAFVHPALAEPWGLVINEAMAAGLPIISSSDVGSAEELVDDGVNGFLFSPTSIDSISMALTNFLALSPERRQHMALQSKLILAERMPSASFGNGLKTLLSRA